MKETNNLELIFKDSKGKNTKVTISDPKEGLDRVTVEAAMNVIKDQNLFAKDGTDLHDSIVGARYVSREIREIFEIKA